MTTKREYTVNDFKFQYFDSMGNIVFRFKQTNYKACIICSEKAINKYNSSPDDLIDMLNNNEYHLFSYNATFEEPLNLINLTQIPKNEIKYKNIQGID